MVLFLLFVIFIVFLVKDFEFGVIILDSGDHLGRFNRTHRIGHWILDESLV